MTKVCVYCGSEIDPKSSEYTRDHIPSKMLFPAGFNIKNPILVPACKKCNNGFAKDEEWFRYFLVNLSQDTSFLADQIFWTKIKRSIEKNPTIGKKLLNNMEIIDYYKSGIYLGKKTKIKLSEDDWERYHNILGKFARGIFYHHVGCRIEELNYIVKHKVLTPNQINPNLLGKLTWNFNNESVFYYAISSVPDTKHTLIIMTFYEHLNFISFITSEDHFKKFETNSKNN